MNISSSQLERLDACPASAALKSYPHQHIGAVIGTENHAKAEAGESLHEKIKAYVDGLSSVEWERLFIIDTSARSVESLPVGQSRTGRDLGPSQISVRMDVMANGVTLDLKSRKRVTAASRNLQVKAQAVVAATIQQQPVRAGIGYLDNGWIDMASFGPIEIAAAWADLRSVCAKVEKVRRLPLADLTFQRGEHCETCNAILVCPAQTVALQTFRERIPATDEEITALVSSMPDEEIVSLLETWKQVSRRGEQFEAAVRMRAEVAPIKDGHGKQYEMRECKGRPSTDWQGLEEFVSSHGRSLSDFQTRNSYKKLMKVNETKE